MITRQPSGVSTKRKENTLSNNVFYHKDSKVSLGMRCTLAIMQRHFADGMEANSIGCAAHKMTDLLDNPSKVGRSYERRCKKMRSAIEVAISRGFLRFSNNEGGLTLTGKGRRALSSSRNTVKRRRPKRYGRTPQLALS